MITESVCNALLAHGTGATVTWQINAMRKSTMSERITSRNVTPVNALRGVTLLIAELTGLSFGTAIRCESLPASVNEGYAVSFAGHGKREVFDATAWNVLFYGRGSDAQTLLAPAAKLAAKLPLPLALTIRDSEMSGNIAIHQLTCGKMKLESIGSKSAAPYTLTVELTAEISR